MKNSIHTILSGFLLVAGLLFGVVSVYATKSSKTDVPNCRDYDYDIEVVQGGTVTASFNEATCEWTLEAVPDKDWDFVRWSNGLTTTTITIDFDGGAVDLEMDEISYKALFTKSVKICKTIQDYDFDVIEALDESGTITFEQTEDAIILTAKPNPGYVFAQWADGTAVNPRTITDFSVDDTTFYASFIPSATKGRITEWNMNGFTLTLGVSEPLVVVSSDPQYNQPITLFYDGEHVSHEIDDRHLGIYYIETPPYSADDLAGKTCHIVYKNKDCEPIATLDATIPYLVSGVEAAVEVPTDYTPVHVLSGGVATFSSEQTIGTLDVYPGGQAVIEDNLMVRNPITLRTDWPNRRGVPDLSVTTGSLTNLGGTNVTINYDYNLNWQTFYPFTVPYAVTVGPSAIHYASGGAAGGRYVLGEYLGALRAEGDGNPAWEDCYNYDVEHGSNLYLGEFTARKGYYIFGDPECWEETVDGNHERQSSMFRFPMSVDLSGGENNVLVPVSEYPSDEISNSNWNLIGLPFLTGYTGHIYLTHDGETALQDDKGVPRALHYITVPSVGFSDYDHLDVSDGDIRLSSFMCYFVQFDNSGLSETVTGLLFDNSAGAARAPHRRAAAAKSANKLKVGITLSHNGELDRTALYIGEQYTNNYDMDADLAKMIGTSSRVKFYSLLGSRKLAYMALPPASGKDLLETTIPLGYESAVAGQDMTFAIDKERYPQILTNENIYQINLIDDVTGESTNLLENSYTCTAIQAADNSRFSLSVVYRAPGQEVPTACEEVRSTALPDGIYDMLGRPVGSNANALPAGAYIVVRDGKAEKEVIR